MVRNLLLAISVIAVAPAFAQAPRTVNPAPLERPEPLCNLRMTEIRKALEVVISTVQSAGFEVKQTKWDDGEATFEQIGSASENRIVVWLAWDLRNPGQSINVFWATGHFERFFGSQEFKRVLLTPTEEAAYFGAIKKALLAESLKRG